MNVFQYRDELRYILDPADVMDEDYPSETFRVLKNKEIREFGERIPHPAYCSGGLGSAVIRGE